MNRVLTRKWTMEEMLDPKYIRFNNKDEARAHISYIFDSNLKF